MSRFKLLTFIIFLISACKASVMPYDPPDREQFIADAKRSLEYSLIDSESAKYRNLRTIIDDSGRVYLCGEINSKNRMGGYVGFKLFKYSREEGGRIGYFCPGENPIRF